MINIKPLKEEYIPHLKAIAESIGHGFTNERDGVYWVLLKFFPHTCFAAVEDGKLLGFLLGLMSQENPKQGFIHMLGVDPTHHNRGIGTTLIHKFEEVVKEKDGNEIYLTTVPDNHKALQFYEKYGFKKRDFLKLGVERVELWKKLQPFEEGGTITHH